MAHSVTPGVVVYNVALIAADSILTSDIEHLLAAYAVDVVGAITAAQVFTPAVRRAGRGTFLVTGGQPSVDPEPQHGPRPTSRARRDRTPSGPRAGGALEYNCDRWGDRDLPPEAGLMVCERDTAGDWPPFASTTTSTRL